MVIKPPTDVFKNSSCHHPAMCGLSLGEQLRFGEGDIPPNSAVVSLVPGKDLGLAVSKLFISGNNTDYLVQFVCRCGG